MEPPPEFARLGSSRTVWTSNCSNIRSIYTIMRDTLITPPCNAINALEDGNTASRLARKIVPFLQARSILHTQIVMVLSGKYHRCQPNRFTFFQKLGWFVLLLVSLSLPLCRSCWVIELHCPSRRRYPQIATAIFEPIFKMVERFAAFNRIEWPEEHQKSIDKMVFQLIGVYTVEPHKN